MARAFLIVLDSVGVGGAPDAAAFGDEGSNTLGHVAAACAAGSADVEGTRSGPLHMPHLNALGLGAAAQLASGTWPEGFDRIAPQGLWGAAEEISNGKDTPSGHWEIAGFPVPFDWGYFPHTIPCFPQDLIDDLVTQASLPGTLGHKHSSGTVILEELGEEHIRTGKPICYTSADSVLQIAAHEEHFGLQRLYKVCEIARELTYPLTIGRVIARPFLGENATNFQRTGNRHDYAMMPPDDTVLDRLKHRGRQVIGIGKISDIFAGKGITKSLKANGNQAVFAALMSTLDRAGDGDLVFANFVDFDQLYGHRRNVAGYAASLEAFDRLWPRFASALGPGDLAIVTADHGCDPTWHGTEHTRERVPVLAWGPGMPADAIGIRSSFADIGESVAAHLGLAPGLHGASFL